MVIKILSISFDFINHYLLIGKLNTEADSRGRVRGGWGGGAPPPPPYRYFLQSLVLIFFFFFLQSLWRTVLFEVELIINSTPLIYVHLKTIEKCLTANHLLFGRSLFYSSNTTSTVFRNVNVILSTTDKINRISNHFLDRWRHEYVVNLRET